MNSQETIWAIVRNHKWMQECTPRTLDSLQQGGREEMYNLKALRLWLVTLCRVRPTISQTFLFVIGQHSALAANTALLPILEAEIFCLQNVNGSMNILLKIYLQVWPSALLHHFIAQMICLEVGTCSENIVSHAKWSLLMPPTQSVDSKDLISRDLHIIFWQSFFRLNADTVKAAE